MVLLSYYDVHSEKADRNLSLLISDKLRALYLHFIINPYMVLDLSSYIYDSNRYLCLREITTMYQKIHTLECTKNQLVATQTTF